jgi:hypothetical protein
MFQHSDTFCEIFQDVIKILFEISLKYDHNYTILQHLAGPFNLLGCYASYVVVVRRRFGTSCRSHVWNEAASDCLTLDDGTDRLPRNVGKEQPTYAE